MDEVEHPLTIGCGPSDIRVTVRYQEDNVMKAFGAGVHEIGHALHGLQRKKEWSELPVNNMGYPSFGESQSRLLENHIGKSRAFWKAYYPHFQKGTQGAFSNSRDWDSPKLGYPILLTGNSLHSFFRCKPWRAWPISCTPAPKAFIT
ncbi:MAG: hypothetical protein ACTSQH_06995, partial [Candidatus Hodarchaeales archaeon]